MKVHEVIVFFFELPQFLESLVVHKDGTLVIKVDFSPCRGNFEKSTPPRIPNPA